MVRRTDGQASGEIKAGTRTKHTRVMPRRIDETRRAEDEKTEPAELPQAAVALKLIAESGAGNLVYVAADERQADALGALLTIFAPRIETLVFPPWDCLPYDRASPSRDAMGRRVSTMQRLGQASTKPRIVVTTVEAAMTRTAPRDVLTGVQFAVAEHEAIDLDALHAFADAAGYGLQDRVDEPGEIEFHGRMVEVFPPGRIEPLRIEVTDGRVNEIHSFDPETQRSTGRMSEAVLGPGSEVLLGPSCRADGRTAGMEHRLPDLYDAPLATLFEALPDALLFVAPGTDERRAAFLDQLEEAAAAQAALGEGGPHRRSPAWQRLYLDATAWQAIVDRTEERDIVDAAFGPIPDFAAEARPVEAFRTFVAAAKAAGRRVVLAGVRRDLAAFDRTLDRHGQAKPQRVSDWQAVQVAAPGAFLALDCDLDEGIVDLVHDIVLVAAADVLGTKAHHDAGHGPLAHGFMGGTAMKIGDTVIHEDHGIGVLRSLEQIEIGGVVRDAARLEYHDGASLLAPVEDLDRVWRYGSHDEAVSLDRLHTEAWSKRRISIEVAVLATARHLVGIATEREGCAAPKLVAPAKDYARFAARFPYPETADQTRAIEAVLADLASGHPMDRLVCGDVGFGKTEVALRAAAVTLLAGRQVALVAPTTVLARQHLQTFARRFAGLGFTIAGLSRLENSQDAKAVKAGLADGSIQMVIGTQAVASAGVGFADLGLMIVDEEQKFGAKMKSDLRAKAAGRHVLTLTATPIPRTLQMALVGIQTVSVIATPPVKRRPIRTFVAAFDPAAVRIALLREHARGGQSFVIVPRIDAIAPMMTLLGRLVPELGLLVAHGELPAEDADRAMVEFARGRGDVLLATNIVESGLDVPRANTMLVCQADRFGMAQLHQLRGRVGRGRAQGVAYLLTEADAEVGEATRERLDALKMLDRLGSGFAISARDLDLRGAGDLVGDEQAGHIRLIGLELYQKLLGRAVRKAKGETVDDDAPPELHLAATGSIPASYVADPDLRIALYARLSRLEVGKAIDAFAAEVEDRFGAMPRDLQDLLAVARLRALCRSFDVASLNAGPKAAALTFKPAGLPRCRALADRPDCALNGFKLVWSGGAGADPLHLAEPLADFLAAVRME